MPAYFGSNSKNYICVVCKPPAEMGIPVMPIYHKHHSTSFFFRQMQSRKKLADCPTCLEIHPPVNTSRIRLLSTSSTLHDMQFSDSFPMELDKTMKDLGLAPGDLHINMDSIPGGKIQDLSYSWLISYSLQPLPCLPRASCRPP